jgi:putative ATPase
LADRLRPRSIEEVIGQEHLLAPGKPLYEALQQGHLHSMVLWGPPGVGKTTLARLFAKASRTQFLAVSAVLSGVKEIRGAVAQAQAHLDQTAASTLLFVDEVHRFNKAQQDAFLPHIESGLITFIGATTENPSFELNNALLSRARTYVLKPLDIAAIGRVLQRAVAFLNHQQQQTVNITDAAAKQIAAYADGDARRAVNLLELAISLQEGNDAGITIDEAALAALNQDQQRRFDQGGEYFYDQISALHKSVRGSSPDGALYWLCRMLDGGADPRYIARRVIRMASEDIGNADPRALRIALDASESFERLGTPEGELALAQAVIYLACAPKSNAVYVAYKAMRQAVKSSGSLEVPLHLRNAPTALMKSLDYGKQYRYAHDEADAYAAGEQYLPDELVAQRFYEPVPRGLEIKIAEKLALLREKDRIANQQKVEK